MFVPKTNGDFVEGIGTSKRKATQCKSKLLRAKVLREENQDLDGKGTSMTESRPLSGENLEERIRTSTVEASRGGNQDLKGKTTKRRESRPRK